MALRLISGITMLIYGANKMKFTKNEKRLISLSCKYELDRYKKFMAKKKNPSGSLLDDIVDLEKILRKVN